MPKDTKSSGNNKAPACESRGFGHKKEGENFDTPSCISKYLYLCPHVLELRRRSVKILSGIEIWTISSNRIIANVSTPVLLYITLLNTKGKLYTSIRRGSIVYYCSMGSPEPQCHNIQ